MRKIIPYLFIFISVSTFAQVQTGIFTVSPPTFAPTDEITITVDNVDPSLWGVTDIYLWTWYYDFDYNFAGNSPTNGSWSNSDESQKFTDNGDGTFSFTFTPSVLFGDTDIGRIGVLAKADDGTGDKKTQDHYFEVGLFQITLNYPTEANTIIDSGDILPISVTASQAGNFELFANGTSVDIQNNITNYSLNYIVNEDTWFELVAEDVITGQEKTVTFNVILTPNPQEIPVPAGMEDGLNFDYNNPSQVTLVLYAPGKDFVHVIGNFNNNDWRLTNNFLLNKDSSQDRFWITLTNLDAGDSNLLYQYVIDGQITVADPYSTYILDEYGDPYIPTSTFPNIPDYPVGKTSHAVTWFDLNEQPYDWQITDFNRPKQDRLVVYELLIRDFDSQQSYEALMNNGRLDYLENLNVNVLHIMPVSEFDGNSSWGYNPAFHMALDKQYGSKEKLKAFIDECHARGIAVIIDVVYNHATGQNPYYRMWNDCNGCYVGQATPENPIFNVNDPNTVFQFFNDINHESPAAQHYIDKLNEYWLTEFNLDGFRFDFTKGFTNVVGDGGGYDASRIYLLERMYDAIRQVDSTAYVILEHFAPNSEETELINHRATSDPQEPGMMVWANHNYTYNEATMGWNNNSNFSWISYLNRGWSTPSNLAYMQSHDEERLMYKNLQWGNSSGSYDIQELHTALDRMELAGAFFFTIPGPKMIWQFDELGYEYSINYCQDGTISSNCRVDPKPIAWNLGYLNEPDRMDVYNVWKKLIGLKIYNPIFWTNNFMLDVGNPDGLKRIQLEDPFATGTQIKYVTILGNFDVVAKNIYPQFQETGTWYNMLDDTTINVTNINDPIWLQPGEYRVYSNQSTYLTSPDLPVLQTLSVYPNPSGNEIKLNKNIDKLSVYSITGKLIFSENNYTANKTISVNNLNTGIYIIKALIDSDVYNIKFIKK